MHVIMRQNLVPWISFHAEFEITVPDFARNAVPNFPCRHVAVKSLTAGEGMSQDCKKSARSVANFGKGINEAFIIARLMPRHWRVDRRQHIAGSAMLREKDFDACAGSLGRFDENEFVFVGDNHFPAI